MRTVTWYTDKIGRLDGLVILLTAPLLAHSPAPAQQVTSVLGSPGATIAIDGKQIAAPVANKMFEYDMFP